MKSIKVCVLLFMSFLFAGAQNLIPDSSYEMNKFVPIDFSSVNASHSWSIPSRGTSDLFCKCDKKTKQHSHKIYSEVDVPQNTMGYQIPHSGNCYAGLFVFSHGDYREYLQTPLKKSLIKNKTYRFTMYVSLADYSRLSIDRLGVCFMNNKVDYQSSDVITDLSPVYLIIEKEVGNDIRNWHRVSVTYRARGGEAYLLFGSFVINRIRKTKLKTPKEIKSRINQKIERDAYYFIDDVSLVETFFNEPADTLINVGKDTTNKILSNTLFILKNVLFNSNETLLFLSSCSELDLVVKYLKQNHHTLIDIYGHTDNLGSETTNKQLSLGRAKAVADYLILNGIDKSRITYGGCGSLKPIATNETEEGRQQNRRVEFKII